MCDTSRGSRTRRPSQPRGTISRGTNSKGAGGTGSFGTSMCSCAHSQRKLSVGKVGVTRDHRFSSLSPAQPRRWGSDTLSIGKEPKLCPAKGPAPTHDAGERRGRRKTRLPSDVNSPSFSGLSDFRAFPLLRQDLTWPERRMDWEGRATTDAQMRPVWPAQLIRGRLFARRV